MKITQDLADAIVKAIADSNMSVLKQRGIADESGEMARELARNAAQDVMALIEESNPIRCLKCGAPNYGHNNVWCTACVGREPIPIRIESLHIEPNDATPDKMVVYPTDPARCESVRMIGPDDLGTLDPPSSFPSIHGCLACNRKAVHDFFVLHGIDPARFEQVPRPRHAWPDIVPCKACGATWLIKPASAAADPANR